MSLKTLAAAVIERWPKHERFLRRSLDERDAIGRADGDDAAELVLRIAGSELDGYCDDYRFTCERITEEEWHFQRHGSYRHARLDEVRAAVYDDPAYMTRYVRGLLLSQALWSNHAGVISALRRRHLASLPPGFRHLEVGPGHGLLLYYAATAPGCSEAHGWDLSETSLAETARTFERLGVPGCASLEQRDACAQADARRGRFHSIVASEVLEHVEAPREMLAGLAALLRPDGRLFVNVPVNSPAPDHIYLLRTPEEAVELVRSAGLEPEWSAFLPMTGFSEERARRQGAAISCVVVARR